MNRRNFLGSLTPKNTGAEKFKSAREITSGLNPYTGPWTKNEVTHLIKRTMFGARKNDIDYFLTRTASQAVDELTNPSAPLPPPPLKNYNNSNTTPGDPDFAVGAGQTWINTFTQDAFVDHYRKVSFRSWWIGNLINQDRSIREKMSLFWHNHFATQSDEVESARYVYSHHRLLREQCLGNFKALVRAITIDPAMLVYLNGRLNTKAAPDENYSRELQELFTLGKENNPNYTEEDVKTAARVLTGWRVNEETNSSYFDAARHDTSDKVFSSFYNGARITGRTGATAGELELDDLINMIFSKSAEVSRFLVKKLYRWFIYYEIDSTTEANIIEPLALMLRNNNWNVQPVINRLLKSEHFFDVLNQGCQIKSPLDLTIGYCREYDLVFPTASDLVTQYHQWNNIRWWGEEMQQALADPPDVSGWKAYYQAPGYYEIWVNSDTYPKRNKFTDVMIMAGYEKNGKTVILDPVAFAKKFSNPADPDILITDILSIIYRVTVSANTLNTIKKDLLLSGQDQNYYWTNTWNAYIANPADKSAYNAVFTRLQNLLKYLMNLAEYQLA
jgi:uncharacterized protein (DUF1800 family)